MQWAWHIACLRISLKHWWDSTLKTVHSHSFLKIISLNLCRKQYTGWHVPKVWPLLFSYSCVEEWEAERFVSVALCWMVCHEGDRYKWSTLSLSNAGYVREMHCHFTPRKEQEPHYGFQNYSITRLRLQFLYLSASIRNSTHKGL